MAKKRTPNQKNYTREATSFILIALGIILMLAIISYDRTDDHNLNIDKNSIQINNWIGPAGAAIADPLMKYTLGYPVLALAIIILMVGVQLFRNNPLRDSLRSIILLFVWAFFLSILFALPDSFETYGKIREYYPSGLLGGATAEFLTIYLGKFGTALIVVAFFSVLSVITLHLDLATVLNSLKELSGGFNKNLKQVVSEWQAERKKRKKEAFLLKQQKKAEAEQIAREKPIEIKTETQRSREPEIMPVTKPAVTQPPPAPEKPMIRTTLDDVLQQAGDGDGKIDTELIKRSARPVQPEPVKTIELAEPEDSGVDRRRY